MSIERLLKTSRLAIPAIDAVETFVADRTVRIARPDRERLDGKVNKAHRSLHGGSGVGQLERKLRKRLGSKPPRPNWLGVKTRAYDLDAFDRRQRAVVKIHYFNHAGAGASRLKAHARYLAHDAEDFDQPPRHDENELSSQAREEVRAHTTYLDRAGRGAFYDTRHDGVDGDVQIDSWAKADLRHFRIILSAEEGQRLGHLPSYTRQVMARADVALGTQLSWIAVDHHDTDNPHTHLVVRGRRANGQDLVLPRDFIRHGLRNIARDVATEWLGRRTPEDERLALDRETRRNAVTRLDRLIATQEDHVGRVQVALLKAPNNDPALTQAMKTRANELERMGLGRVVDRGVLELASDWLGRLQAMELHADIRKRVIRARTQKNTQDRAVFRGPRKGSVER